MALTALITFTANSILTAAQLNTYIGSGGNLGHMCAVVVTTAGDTTYATNSSTMGRVGKGFTGQVYRQSGGNAPEWFSLTPIMDGARSTTGSFSSVTTQKATVTLAIPTSWSTGWNLMAWGVVRFVWDGTATSGDAELLIGGVSMTPNNEQDIVTTAVNPVSVIGHELSTSTGSVTVGLAVTGNGTGTYADAWVTALACVVGD